MALEDFFGCRSTDSIAPNIACAVFFRRPHRRGALEFWSSPSECFRMQRPTSAGRSLLSSAWPSRPHCILPPGRRTGAARARHGRRGGSLGRTGPTSGLSYSSPVQVRVPHSPLGGAAPGRGVGHALGRRSASIPSAPTALRVFAHARTRHAMRLIAVDLSVSSLCAARRSGATAVRK